MFTRSAPKNHARHDFVAVGDAHGGIERMALNSAFKAVGNSLARNQRVMHAVVVHGNAVANANGGNLERRATGLINAGLYGFADLIEVGMPGNDVVAGIENRDERALHLFIG